MLPPPQGYPCGTHIDAILRFTILPTATGSPLGVAGSIFMRISRFWHAKRQPPKGAAPACRKSLSRRSAHKIENCNKLQLLSLECREAAISKIEGYGLIKTGSMYLGFYTNRCQVCLKGARRQRNFRSEAWFRSRGCSKNYVFRQPQAAKRPLFAILRAGSRASRPLRSTFFPHMAHAHTRLRSWRCPNAPAIPGSV